MKGGGRAAAREAAEAAERERAARHGAELRAMEQVRQCASSQAALTALAAAWGVELPADAAPLPKAGARRDPVGSRAGVAAYSAGTLGNFFRRIS